MMSLKIGGGAGEHGRSCYIIHGKQYSIMLDCGAKRSKEDQYPLFNPEDISRLNAVFVSHAHEDHSAGIPLLYKCGYQGEIWTTRITASLLQRYFTGWKKWVEARGGICPYGDEHIDAIKYRYLEEEGTTGEWVQVEQDMFIQWGRTGHLAGSVWFKVRMEQRLIFFSGDYTRDSLLLAYDAPEDDREQLEHPDIDLAIIDNAYGIEQESQHTKLTQLYSIINNTILTGGHVLLPIPAFGRSQDMVVWAFEQFSDKPVHFLVEDNIWEGMIDLSRCASWLSQGASARLNEVIQQKEQGKIIVPNSNEQRQQLLNDSQSVIIFVTDGMMESPLSRWYYEALSEYQSVHHNHNVILTGHAASDTFGHQLLEQFMQAPNEVSVPVHHVNYKIHQNIDDVKWMMKQVPSHRTVLVHADQHKTKGAISHLLQYPLAFPYSLNDQGQAESKLHFMLAGDWLEF